MKVQYVAIQITHCITLTLHSVQLYKQISLFSHLLVRVGFGRKHKYASCKPQVKVQPIGVSNISHMLLSLHWASSSV